MKRWLVFLTFFSTLALVSGCTARKSNLVNAAPNHYKARTDALVSDPTSIRAGARLYAGQCADCHGDNREGVGNAPRLDDSRIYNAPPGALFWAVRSGSVFRGMPSFAHLPAPQRWQIVAFLKEKQTPSASRSK
jgi:mono/diheme cytochrome c family protein